MSEESPTVHPYELRAHNTKSLLQRLYHDLSTLVAEEVDLAKSEAHQRSSIALIVAALSLRAMAGRTLARATEPALSKLNVLLSPVKDSGTLAERRARIEWSQRQVDQTITALSHKTDILSLLRETAFGLGSLGVAVSALVRNDKDKQN
jgi:hypothetical protein